MNKITALCKRRGFYFPSSDIYGGLANCWDFGHYGTLLKNNLRDLWWKKFVIDRDDMVAIDAAILQSPSVWKASGHITGFNDAMVDCKKCHNRTRADYLIEDQIKGKKVEGLKTEELTQIIVGNKLKCPKCGAMELTDVRTFNLLFTTNIGIIEGEKSEIYLRGEIAQGIFINFKNVTDTMRVRLPFGIAQQGKAFRNEITMGNAVHRTLEFDLMEFEYFIRKEEWKKVYKYWQDTIWSFALNLGISKDRLRWREHEEFERSFYSTKTMDVEYKYTHGWMEIFGLAYRTDYDLKNHMKHSGKDLSYVDPITREKIVPHVIEPTFGLSRLTGVILSDAYREDIVNGKIRVFLKINPSIAPVKIAVFPLQKDKRLYNLARQVYLECKHKYHCEFDDSGNIGKMYRRQDEIGTPYCITVDYESLKDKAITIRERDSMKQERIPIVKIFDFIKI